MPMMASGAARMATAGATAPSAVAGVAARPRPAAQPSSTAAELANNACSWQPDGAGGDEFLVEEDVANLHPISNHCLAVFVSR